MVRFWHELQRLLEVLDRGTKFPAVQLGDPEVVVVVSRTEDGPRLILNLLFAGMNQNFCAFLNFGFFGMLTDEIVETTDRPIEFLAVHQLEPGLICLYGIFKM